LSKHAEDGYEMLAAVLQDALDQAQHGKGKERHAEGGKPFHAQDICQEARDLGLAYPIGQARKKAKEALRLPPGKAIEDLLGAINYLAAAVIVVHERESDLDGADYSASSAWTRDLAVQKKRKGKQR